MWRKYRNKSLQSCIVAYEIIKKDKVVHLKWRDSNRIFDYNHSTIGERHYKKLVYFAKKGSGLQRYIHAKKLD